MRPVLLIVLALELLLPGSIRPHVHTQAGYCQDLQSQEAAGQEAAGQEAAGQEVGNQGLSASRRSGVARTCLHFHFGPTRHRHSHTGPAHAGHSHGEYGRLGQGRLGQGRLGQGHGQAETAASRPRRFRFASEPETSARQSDALSHRHDRCREDQGVVRDYVCSHFNYDRDHHNYNCSHHYYVCSHGDDYVCSHCDCSHGGDVIYLGCQMPWVSTQRQSAAGNGLANWAGVPTTWSSELTAVLASVRSVAEIPRGKSVSSHGRLPHVLRI